jgi:hypothetical protein
MAAVIPRKNRLFSQAVIVESGERTECQPGGLSAKPKQGERVNRSKQRAAATARPDAPTEVAEPPANEKRSLSFQ